MTPPKTRSWRELLSCSGSRWTPPLPQRKSERGHGVHCFAVPTGFTQEWGLSKPPGALPLQPETDACLQFARRRC